LQTTPIVAKYIVWHDYVNGKNQIFFMKSTNDGNTWGDPVQLTARSGNAQYPTFAEDGSNLYVAWEDYTDTGIPEIYLSRSTDGSETWSTQRLTNNTGYSKNPAIAVSGSNVYIVWQDDAQTPGYTEIFFKKSTDGGATWTFQNFSNTPTGNSINPAITANGSNVHVAWQDTHEGGPGFPEIYVKSSTDNGANWTSPVRVTNNTGASRKPAIAADGSNVYVVWQDATILGAHNIFFKKSTDGGASWGGFAYLTQNVGNSANASIAINGSKIYIAWQDDWETTSGVPEIYVTSSADSGQNWTTQRLTTNAGYSRFPVISVNGNNVYVGWEDDAQTTPGSEKPEIFFKKSADSGATWSFKRLTTTTGSSNCPVM
jgi:hypothetical protein